MRRFKFEISKHVADTTFGRLFESQGSEAFSSSTDALDWTSAYSSSGDAGRGYERPKYQFGELQLLEQADQTHWHLQLNDEGDDLDGL